MTDSFTPPAGINFRSDDALTLSVLSTCLCQNASFLQDIVSSATLKRYEDWWEHDGLHFEKGQIDIHGLFRMVETGRSIYEATPCDEYVCVGIAPADGRWRLRFRADWDDGDSALVGRFDVTLVHNLAEEFRQKIVPHVECRLTEEAANLYYARIIV